MSNVAQNLYRFMPNSPTHLAPALDGKLWLSSASSFNDPWDCTFQIHSTPRLSDYHRRECASYYERQSSPALRSLFAPPQEPFSQLPGSNLASASPWAEVIQDRLAAVAVACFCTDVRNHLLWSYYGRNHTGVCLRYELTYTRDGNPYPDVLVGPVRYSSHYPIIEVEEMLASRAPIKQLQELLFTKHLSWAHEKEWRIIQLGRAGNAAYSTPPQLRLSEVIAGSRVSDSAFSALGVEFAKIGIPVSKLQRSKYSYSLLSSGEMDLSGIFDPKYGRYL